MQIVNITNRGQVTIPHKMRKDLNLKSNKKVLISKDGDKITLIPIKDVNIMDLYGSIDPGNKSADPIVATKRARIIKFGKTS